MLCTGDRVILDPPWYNHFVPRPIYTPPSQVYIEAAPSPVVIVDSHPRQVAVIRGSQEDDARAVRVATVAVIALVIIAIVVAVAVSNSRDCRFIATECSEPNWFGEQRCQDVWDCKW